MLYRDRSDAGRRLAARLESRRAARPIVLGLPRGGVVVAAEVAAALDAPLDVLCVRKVGAPGAEEFALGAVAADVTVMNQILVADLGIPRRYLEAAVQRERAELRRRERLYRGERAPMEVRGRSVLVVDDGLATGATALAAVQVLRRLGAGRIVVAAPVGSAEAVAALRAEADEVVCLEVPAEFRAVGLWYDDFLPTTDAEVISCLRAANQRRIPA